MNNIAPYTIRAVEEQDRDWVLDYINTQWGDDFIVVHEDVYYPHQLPGYIAKTPKDQTVGLVTYQIHGSTCEIITLNSLIEKQGVGSRLIEAVLLEARKSGCSQLRLTTTNDNQRAIEFYQNRGFRLREVRKGAVDRSRELKPSIPLIASNGQSICDEWVFELELEGPN